MTTKPSERLRELREEFELLNTMADAERSTPSEENRECSNVQATRTGRLLDEAIAQAEAQEAQAGELSDFDYRIINERAARHRMHDNRPGADGCADEFGDGAEWGVRRFVKDHGYLRPSQAGELSDFHYNVLKERMIEEHRKYGDKLRFGHWADIAARKVVSHLRDMGYLRPSQATPVVTHLNMDPNASPETIEAVKDMVQKAYSYKPSQAIGEQTPVAWYIERVVPGKRDNGVRMGPFFDKEEADELADEYHFVSPLYRSPMSSEARDKAIEALENAKRNASGCTCDEAYKSRGIADPDCAACDFHEVMQFVDQALSALRGE